jgi:hypothetical protein
MMGLSASLARPLLVLFDRNFDLSGALQQPWTYKPLVQVRARVWWWWCVVCGGSFAVVPVGVGWAACCVALEHACADGAALAPALASDATPCPCC